MTELDPRGLEAAVYAWRYEDLPTGWDKDDPLADFVSAKLALAVRAYLNVMRTSELLGDLQRMGQECEATRPEGEPDRIAVVIDRDGAAMGWTFSGSQPTSSVWQELEVEAKRGWGSTQWSRAVVECRLPRPAEPVTVQGRVA